MDETTVNRTSELKERLGEINKQLLTLQWDKDHNQLNVGMESKILELKIEHDKIVEEMSGQV